MKSKPTTIAQIICAIILQISVITLNAQELLKGIDNAHAGQINTLSVSADGDFVLTGGNDNRAFLWDVKEAKKVKILSHGEKVMGVAFNASNKLYATASADKKQIVFDYAMGKPVKLLSGQTGIPASLAFNPINDNIATGGKDNLILVWDVSGKLMLTIKGHEKSVNAIAYSSDGKKIVSASEDKTIRVWDAMTGQEKNKMEAGNELLSVAWSADGKFIAAGDNKGVVSIWDGNAGSKIGDLSGAKSAVNSLSFSPDVQYLAAGCDDGKIMIWDMNSRQIKTEVSAHTDAILTLSFNEGGKILASGGKDMALKIWDVANLKIGKKKFMKEGSGETPKIVCSPITIKDDNSNGIIETSEKTTLTLTVDNKGNGTAYNVKAKTALESYVRGLSFEKEILVGNMDANSSKTISIPVSVDENLESTAGIFIVSVSEANDHNPTPVKVNFQTRGAQQYSFIMVTAHEFTSTTGKADIGAPITLKMKLKNTSKGEAKDIKVNYLLPDKVMAVDKLSEMIPTIKAEEEREITMQFYADKGFTGKAIKIGLSFENVAFTNANDLILSVNMNESLTGAITHEPLMQASAEEKPMYRASGDMLAGLNVSKAKTMEVGKYYALIVGIDKYSGDWTPLKNAVNDAKKVEEVIKSKYKFDHFKSLYNEQATRNNIITELEWLEKNALEKDNVFIYYSGHGDYKLQLNKGFWVPVDAKSNASTAGYISNADIQMHLSSIKSKHTLLVSDACFSGDIFRGTTVSVPFEESEKYYREVHNLPSRQALTSGGIEPVLDGGKDGHSVFAYYFLKTLSENNSKYLDASQLYNKIKIPVINNSEQTPKLAPVKNSGDEGGQFIFIQK